MTMNAGTSTNKPSESPMTSGEAQAAMSELRSDLADLRADLKTLRLDAQHLARSTARTGMDFVSDTAERARGAARDAAGQAQEIHHSFEDRIRRQPTASVLVAMGVGALAARLLAGRRR